MKINAKISRNNKNTMSNTPSSFIELKMQDTIFFNVSMRFTTRNGRNALRIRNVFNSDGPPPEKPMIDTATTVKSSQFHAQPGLQKYALSPQIRGHASILMSISTMKIPAKTMSKRRTATVTAPLGSASGKSTIMQSVDSKMHTKMIVSKMLIEDPLILIVWASTRWAHFLTKNSFGKMNQDQPYGHSFFRCRARLLARRRFSFSAAAA
mmetsp:Transcript_36807/g.106158  ORF Transcript_36807/g.106158 Transcript_36807/m.106158 type:complete len:209 (-) Transcript_36807:980-1606(-)